jgi:flagellin FlaB
MSKLEKVTCPSCNQKTPNSTLRRPIKQLVQHRRAIIGLEAAIVLIAFVIIAAAFSFMVVNQGLFATERGKTVIQEGLRQSSTPLIVDGTCFFRTNPQGKSANIIIVPLKAFGVKYVPMGRNQTAVMLKVGQKAWANAYLGLLYVGYNATTHYETSGETYDPTGCRFDEFVGFQLANQTTTAETCDTYVNETYSNGISKGLITGAILAIANSNGDEALDADEKGYLIISLADEDAALARAEINVEIRLEKTAPLSLEWSIPTSMPKDAYVPI